MISFRSLIGNPIQLISPSDPARTRRSQSATRAMSAIHSARPSVQTRPARPAPDVPEIYVVIEFLQSNFDIFRLVGRFILEDPEGKPVGTLLHTDKAQFENQDTGGYLVMKRPPGGFPVGNYRVEIHYEAVTDMSLLSLARFKVVPAAAK